MERIFNEQETQAIFEAEKILRSQGLIVSEADGKEEYEQNFERISSYLELNSQAPVTVEMILRGCEQMRDQMCWKSKAQMDYDAAFGSLTTDQKNVFGVWWSRQKNVLILEGDQGFENATKLIGWMKGRSFDSHMLGLALTNLAANSGLHLVRQSTFKPGRHSGSDRSFAPKSESNLTARDHARRAAEASKAKSGKSEQPSTDYRGLAETINGRTHSETIRIRRMFVMKSGTSEVDWQQTYAARRRAAGL